MEQYLKEIAKELRLIREELQLENDLLMKEIGVTEQPKEERVRPNITEQLNRMFSKDEQ